MSRISQEIIDRVRNSADIVDVVSQYVDLKQRGRNFFGLCPFHHEKTASFSVAPDKEIYHCFGCGAGGNAINFIMEIEKISFVESVKRLGERYGIEVISDETDDNRELITLLYDIHARAMKYFSRELFNDAGKVHLKYLYERGLKEETLKEFNVGFSPDNWDSLYQLAVKAGFSKESIEKSGLFSNTRKGWMDRFRGRIIFPITNLAGKPIGFGGRAVDPEDPAKYLNSPETPIYYKTNTFYGMASARSHIREAGFLVLVEGYMDFLQLYQAGIKNVVAVSGTAFSDRHVAQLRKFTSKVLLAYDGDRAGVSAAIKAGFLLLQGGLEAQIIPLPEGLDPDDHIREKGGEAFKDLMAKALPVLDFQIEKFKVLSLSAPEKARYLQSVLKEIVLIQDRIIQDDLIRSLAEKLRVPEDDIIKRLRRERQLKRPGTTEQKQKVIKNNYSSAVQKAQIEILRLLNSGNSALIKSIKEELSLSLFTEPLLKKAADFLLKNALSEKSNAALLDIFENRDERNEMARILLNEEISENSLETFHDCIKVLKIFPLKEKIKEARLKVREMESKGEDPTRAVIEVANLQEELRQQQQE